MVAEPTETAVTNPSLDTVATDDSEEIHETFLYVAFFGVIAVFNLIVSPITIFAVYIFSETELTATSSSTFEAQETIMIKQPKRARMFFIKRNSVYVVLLTKGDILQLTFNQAILMIIRRFLGLLRAL